jgi:hypothetical protein
MRYLLVLCLCWSVWSVRAAEDFTVRERDVDAESPYVTLDLAPVANAAKPLGVPGPLVSVQRIPFQVLTGASQPNHLSMQPIGWSAVNNEAREYPGYMATYDRLPEKPDPTRAILPIPVADYEAVYVLAATDDDPALTGDLTLRFHVRGGPARTDYHDFAAQIPRAGDKKIRVGQQGVVKIIAGAQGNLYLVRIPINRAFAQHFKDHWAMYLDLTRKLDLAINLPDPYRFQLRPLGDPSGVRIYGLTLERPSLHLEVTGQAPGNVWNQPELPTFELVFRNHFEHYREYTVEAVAVRDDGVQTVTTTAPWRPWAPAHKVRLEVQQMTLPLTERGHYEVTFRLLRGKELITTTWTTLAILAPDTRQHRLTGPYGTWDFSGTHNTPSDLRVTGTLAVKAGWRYMREAPEYGLEAFNDPNYHGGDKTLDPVRKAMKENPDWKAPKRVLIFHETAISGPHITRTPDVFTGKSYKLDEAEQKTFDGLWESAHTAYKFVQENMPTTEVYLGNGAPHLVEEFCRRGISKDYLKIAGNESGSFMRPPETQPLDFVSSNAGIWMFRQILDHYGYQDTKVYQCFEINYPGTNPGNLSMPTQAEYTVRHILHSLAWRIPIIRPGAVTDMGTSYYFSNWGSSGYCYTYPYVCPKQSYVAYAVLTQQLDGATFTRMVPTGTTTLYALEFKKPAGGYVTVLWTSQGQTTDLAVRLPTNWLGRVQPARLVTMLGREPELATKGPYVYPVASTSPSYLHTAAPVAEIAHQAANMAYAGMPSGQPFMIAKLDSLEAWDVVTNQPDQELEVYNFMQPRRPGNFHFSVVPAQWSDGTAGVQVTPQLPVPGPVYLPMHSSLRLKQPVEIPGVPTEIGLWVEGNGGWGRLIFELEDAGGQRWISLGAEMDGEPNPWMADWLSPAEFNKLRGTGKAGISDWNSNDPWARGVINHDGWRYVRFPLPGQYGAKQDIYHWPMNSQWRWSGDGKVKYPLKFKRLAITLPEKVLYGTEYVAPRRPSIVLAGLQATYAPNEEAFAAK